MSQIESADRWLPLTMGQLDFWEEYAAHPDRSVSTVAHYVEIEGDVDVDALLKAMSQATREAEVLSARFRHGSASEEPRQCFDPRRAPEAHCIDLRDFADPFAKAKTLMEADLGTQLDLTSDRLSAQSLFRVGDKRYLWYLRAHHIIVDGYGLALVEQRCGQLYDHFRDNAEAGPSFHAFAAFIEEEEAYRRSRRWQADRDFWTRYLDLPVDLPVIDRANQEDGEPARQHCKPLSDATCRKLMETACSVGIGWPDLLVLLSGTYLYHTLPRQHAGDHEILTLWLPFMSRWGSVGAHLPAMLVNLLPFHVSLDPRETLGALLASNADMLKKQRRHGRYRIEEISAERGIPKDRRFHFSPLINVLPFNTPQFSGCRATRHVIASGPGDGVDLTFRGHDDGNGLTLRIEADPELVDSEAFARHCRDLPAFLELCLSPEAMDRPVADLWDGFIAADPR